MKQISLNSIKTQNIKLLFDIIANNDKITRSDAAKLSGLSLMTVSNIVDHLDRFDIIRHVDKEQTGTVGRRAELLSINKDIKRFIIIDLTSLEFSFIVLNLDLTIHYRFGEWRYNSRRSYQDNLEEFLLIIDEYINAELLDEGFISIGVSVPGPYDVDNDIVINKRIPSLMQLHLKSLINKVLIKDKTINYDIFIDEDVKFAAQANIMEIPEYMRKIIYYVYIGEGVGGAISVNGSIVRGAYSFTGDLGQVLANENTSYEELISTRAFAKEVFGNDNIVGNDEGIIKMLEEYKAENNDKIKEHLAKICRHIALALYNVIWFIDPHVIIIECGYAGLGGDDFLENIKSMLSKMLLPVRQSTPEILLSNDSTKNAYIGASIILRNKWLESIS